MRQCISVSDSDGEPLKTQDLSGLQRQARRGLHAVLSKSPPFGHEMARWLYQNWPLSKIDELGSSYRRLFMLGIGDVAYYQQKQRQRPTAARTAQATAMTISGGLRITIKSMPEVCLIRHTAADRTGKNSRYYGTFIGTPMCHKVVFGFEEYGSVDIWIEAIRKSLRPVPPRMGLFGKQKEGVPLPFETQGSWWRLIQVKHGKYWARLVEDELLTS